MTSKLKIDLVGTFRVRGASGADCTPRGAKARALIGILALTSDFRRSRRWIESRLWSDRGEQQARRSLRQTLSEIRKALGPDRDAIEADREHVWLRKDRIRVDAVHDAAAACAKIATGRELMEGLSVRDEEFEDWLRGERAHLENAGVLLDRRAPGANELRTNRANCRLIVHSDWELGAEEELAVRMCSEFLAGYFNAQVEIRGQSRSPAKLTVDASNLVIAGRRKPGRETPLQLLE